MSQIDITKATIKETKELDIDLLYVGKNQQRKNVAEKGLKELAKSIKAVGLLQPILVLPDGKDKYEVLAGQRRLYAHQLYIEEKKTIRCQILDEGKTTDLDAKLYSWTENMQREEPTFQEAFDMCTEVYKHYGNIDAVVSKTGIGHNQVKKYVKLERLPSILQDKVNDEDLKLEDALDAWDLVSENDGSPEMAIEYAREFGMITSAKEKTAVKKVAQKNKVSPKKARPMAKKLERVEVKIVLLPNEAEALNDYANTSERPQELAAYDLLKDGLSSAGFLDEDD
jgi:ParB family transcriptional regulator, chromosome partitioning protein